MSQFPGQSGDKYGGKSPSEIENQLKFSPFISDAVVVGDKRPHLACLIMIDQESVEKFAQDNDVPFTNYTSLCYTQPVQDLIWEEIEKVNSKFAPVETIKAVPFNRSIARRGRRGVNTYYET